MFFILVSLIKIVALVVPVLVGVAYFTLVERKVLSAIQRRRGPNVIGIFGLLSPLSDGLKLLLKETIIPSDANKFLFLLAPVITFVVALLGWCVIPVGFGGVISDVPLGIL
jgi:NADH:ubiquinone oxidoreductase subunit H